MAEQKKVKLITELRALDQTALTQKIAELRKELVEQQRAHKAGELPSAAVISKTRKGIATALTILKQKSAEQPAKEQEK